MESDGCGNIWKCVICNCLYFQMQLDDCFGYKLSKIAIFWLIQHNAISDLLMSELQKSEKNCKWIHDWCETLNRTAHTGLQVQSTAFLFALNSNLDPKFHLELGELFSNNCSRFIRIYVFQTNHLFKLKQKKGSNIHILNELFLPIWDQ